MTTCETIQDVARLWLIETNAHANNPGRKPESPEFHRRTFALIDYCDGEAIDARPIGTVFALVREWHRNPPKAPSVRIVRGPGEIPALIRAQAKRDGPILKATSDAAFVCSQIRKAAKGGANKDAAGKAATADKPKLHRRRRPARNPRPITDLQFEAIETVGTCGGNKAKAARQLGINLKSLKDRLAGAWKKLGAAKQRETEKSWETPKEYKGLLKDKDGQPMADRDYRGGAGIRQTRRTPMHRTNDRAAGDRDDI